MNARTYAHTTYSVLSSSIALGFCHFSHSLSASACVGLYMSVFVCTPERKYIHIDILSTPAQFCWLITIATHENMRNRRKNTRKMLLSPHYCKHNENENYVNHTIIIHALPLSTMHMFQPQRYYKFNYAHRMMKDVTDIRTISFLLLFCLLPRRFDGIIRIHFLCICIIRFLYPWHCGSGLSFIDVSFRPSLMASRRDELELEKEKGNHLSYSLVQWVVVVWFTFDCLLSRPYLLKFSDVCGAITIRWHSSHQNTGHLSHVEI